MRNKQIVYRYFRYNGKPLHARREIPYEIKITSRLLLDELCFKWNKEKLITAINRSIDQGNKQEFMSLSKRYAQFIWE